ncbi:ABC transporter permease [Clostridium sp. DSM 100503]|uniref:ABC transporter permease n=1 Tax=Clostridium sp. DSM 100503 TaxID=2963282 RepID=UPI002149CA60|nr:ABC transporter permease [Clostridium sp. DSM 100503]MCR1950505.1 ABC transporter permease [Clostridium sp. DSM 100503]
MSEKVMENKLTAKKNKLDLKGLAVKYSIYLVLVVLIISFSIISSDFLGVANISNFFRQIPTVGILTVAYAMILITGNVDLSMGANAAFSGCVAVYLAVNGFNPIISILAALIVGALWGCLNGVLITSFKLDSFILTLGTSYLIRGIILFLTNGIYIKGLPEWFYKISNTKIGTPLIHANTVIFFLIFLVIMFIMKNTRYGRYCYSIGSNREASRLSGINVNKHIIKVYVVEGLLAAVAGILLMSNINVGAPSEINGPELYAMAGSIMGGVAFGGGIGSIGGAIVGIFTIQVFQNGLSILGVNSFIQQAVTGAIIIVAIVVDFYRRKGSLKKKAK